MNKYIQLCEICKKEHMVWALCHEIDEDFIYPLKYMDPAQMERIKELVKDVEVDLNETLPEENEI